jgi:hypothetical protein
MVVSNPRIPALGVRASLNAGEGTGQLYIPSGFKTRNADPRGWSTASAEA